MKYFRVTIELEDGKREWLEEAECLTEAFSNVMQRKGINLNNAKEVTIKEVEK